MSTEVLKDKSYYGHSKIAQWGVADDQMTTLQKWLCFSALFLFATFALYSNMMLAPCLMGVAETFGIEPANMGWIMSVFTVTGLILAYPATWIMQTFGIKTSVVASGVLSLLGNFICLSSNGDAAIFMAGRAVQGCGMGLICVLGPNIMPRLMPMEKMGVTMGIWSQWVVPGIAIASFTTAGLYAEGGWQMLFYVSTAATAICLALVLVFVKMPLVPENVLYAAENGDKKAEETQQKPQKGYPVSAVLVGIVFFAWCFEYGTFNSYYPTFAQEVAGMDMFGASLTTFIAAVATSPGGIFVGWLADKLRMRKAMLLVGLAITAVYAAFFMWRFDSASSIYVGCVFLGLVCAALVPTATRVLIPVLAVDPKVTDWALTGMAFVTQLANLLAGFFMTIVAARGYEFAGYIVGALMCVAFIIMLFVKSDRAVDRPLGK